MKLLVFDTSTVACSVALVIGENTTFLLKELPRAHTRVILPIINQLLTESSLALSDLDAIGYGCGPGSFTGLRIASAVAQALAFAADKPILKVSSLALLAQTVYLSSSWDKILVATDARMNHLYAAYFEVNEKKQMTVVGSEKIISHHHIGSLVGNTPLYGVGDGWCTYKNELAAFFPIVSENIKVNVLPHPHALAALAKHQFEAKCFYQPTEAMPCYLWEDNAEHSFLNQPSKNQTRGV